LRRVFGGLAVTVGALLGCVACGTPADQPSRSPRWDVVEAQVADLSPGYRRDTLTFAGSRYGRYAAVWIDGAGEWCAAQLTFVDVGDEDAAAGGAAVVSGLPVCAAVSGAPVSLSGDE
jgi:hypothetical protein